MQEFEAAAPALGGRFESGPGKDGLNIMNRARDHGRLVFTGPGGYIGEPGSYTDWHVDVMPAINTHMACGTPVGSLAVDKYLIGESLRCVRIARTGHACGNGGVHGGMVMARH